MADEDKYLKELIGILEGKDRNTKRLGKGNGIDHETAKSQPWETKTYYLIVNSFLDFNR